MIYYIHITCLCCNQTKAALVQAADVSQVNRIGGYLEGLQHRLVCKGIVAKADGADFANLKLEWLRCGPSGWLTFPAWSNECEEHHLLVMQDEYRQHAADAAGY